MQDFCRTPKVKLFRENEKRTYWAHPRAYVVADSDVSSAQFSDYWSRIAANHRKIDFVLLSGDLLREARHEPTFKGLRYFLSPESGSPWEHPVYLPEQQN